MKCQNGFSSGLLLLYFSSAVILTGCAPEKREPVRQCPGKSSRQQALDALQSSAAHLRPFVAYGSGRVSFYEEGKGKPRNERIPTIKLWFEPPGNVRFWGEVAFNPRGLDVGSNEREFWLAAKPKEIGNVYIWGLWSEQTEQTDMLLSPKILRQALGVIETEENKLWSFSPNLSGDVLTLYDEQGRIVRRVHIDNCQYRISSIEYFDEEQDLTATLQLGNYQDIGGMFVPEAIKIINHNYEGNEDTFEIGLKSVKPADKIKAAVFERPDTKGFEEIRQIIKGRAVKYAQPN
jgi:hypothetical protein